MDQIREFFYWTVSIAAILFGLFLIVAIVAVLNIRRMAKRNMERMRMQMEDMGRTWRNLAFSRTIIRILKMIF